MTLRYLIDENLPYYFSLWNSDNFIHVHDLKDIQSDTDVWEYAKKHCLIIISKDSDFSQKIMYKTPPPKVIHIKIGNIRIQRLHELLNKYWVDIEDAIQDHKLVNVFIDRIESIS